jgi:hypothetical protein
MSTGNFIQLTQSINGISPGFGKIYLLYSTEKDVNVSSLTAAAINAERAAGTIIGMLSGWSTVAGASVAEKGGERATSEMYVNKPEILADTLTFKNDTVKQYVTEKASGDTFNVLLLDDMGYAFGEQSLKPSCVKTMKVNFSAKTTNGFQYNQTDEKTVALTARYLVKKIGYVYAGTEVEDIIAKDLLIGKVSSITTHTASSIVFVMDLFSEYTSALLTTFVTTALDVDVSVNGIDVTATGTFALNQLTLTLTKTVADFNTATDLIRLELSTELYYLPQITIKMADFLV